MITRMLLASVLAVGASSFAGCGDGDCPPSVTPFSSCSSAGLTCYYGIATCQCVNGLWSCPTDMPMVPIRDLATHDLTPSSD